MKNCKENHVISAQKKKSLAALTAALMWVGQFCELSNMQVLKVFNISYASVVFLIKSFLWQLRRSQVDKLQLQGPDTKTTTVNLQEETFLRYFRHDQSSGEQN